MADGEVTAGEVGEAAAATAGRVVGQGTVGQRHAPPGVGEAPAAAWGLPAPEREPGEREGSSRGHLQEAERRGTGVPLNDGGRRPFPHNAQRAANHGEARGIVPAPVIQWRQVINGRQGIGPRPQGQGIRVPIRIRRRDGVDEARHSPTRKVGGLARLPAPEEAEEHHEHWSTAPPPCAPPASCPLLLSGVHTIPFVRSAMRG